MSKGAPQQPSATQIASAQSAANIDAIRESARINSLNQYGPEGSTTYQKDSRGLPVSQTVTLNPQNQAFHDLSGRLRNQLGGKAEELAGYLPNTPFEGLGEGAGDRVANALYQRKLGMIQPELDRAQNNTNVMLSERGIPMGSEIWRGEQDRLGRQKADTLAGLSQDAVLAGGNEENRQLSNALTLRNQPFNEVSAFMQGSPAMNQPGFQNTPAYNMQAPNIAGLMQDQYKNQQGQYNSQMQGLFGLGQAALQFGMPAMMGLSDRRMKTDIKKVGTLDNGVPVYTFRYSSAPRGPTYMGVMADELQKVKPEAVFAFNGLGGQNLLMVDYAQVV